MSIAAPALSRSRVTSRSVPWIAVALVAGAAGLLGLQAWASLVGYPLRVTSDVPTYLALLRNMAAHPLAGQSPFLASSGVTEPTATPYLQALAWMWHGIASPDQVDNPVAAGRFLGFVGIAVSFSTLAMVAAYARMLSGRAAALIVAPVLLLLFGPAHVIWANDLSLNGLLYAGFFPQNAAISLALGALIVLRRSGRASLIGAAALSGATIVVHPLTGTVLAGLMTVEGCWLAWRGAPGAGRAPVALGCGFCASLAWPAYSVNQAMAQSGISGAGLVTACVALPALVLAFGSRLQGASGLTGRALAATRAGMQACARALTTRRCEAYAAAAGAVLVTGLAVWQTIELSQALSNPSAHNARLALYWGEDRWRWFLMLGAGAVGVCGLVRLARRGQILPLAWFGGCFGIALLGLIGMPVPVWWRFLLIGQIPLAIGVVTVLAESASDRTRLLVTGTFAFVLAFKLATLLAPPPTVTYFGSPLQSIYRLGPIIPSTPGGLVASDPFTSYYIPGVSGHKVLTVTKAHVESKSELDASAAGYALLHRLYVAGNSDWWASAQALWHAGVRYVLLEKRTSLSPGTLAGFSTGPTPAIRSASDEQTMGRMYWRLGRVGTLLHTDPEYAIYALSGARLTPSTGRKS